MNVALPILTVIPSLDGPVLAALASSTGPRSLTAVHRLAGVGSLSGVRKALLRLVAGGVVDEVPGGYVLNREHVAAPAVEMLADLHGELARRIRDAVSSWGGHALLVGLFGSAARRDGDADSDIDLLVVTNDSSDVLADTLTTSIERWTGNAAHIVIVSESELLRLRRSTEPIVDRWERELVVLSGDRRVLGGRP
jgi:predicted nucleotidyltransferase